MGNTALKSAREALAEIQWMARKVDPFDKAAMQGALTWINDKAWEALKATESAQAEETEADQLRRERSFSAGLIISLSEARQQRDEAVRLLRPSADELDALYDTAGTFDEERELVNDIRDFLRRLDAKNGGGT